LRNDELPPIEFHNLLHFENGGIIMMGVEA